MKNRTKSRSNTNVNRRRRPIYRRPWFYLVLILVAAAIAFGVWFFCFRDNSGSDSVDTVDTSDTSSGKVPYGAETKAENKSTDDPNAETGKKQTPSQYDGEDPNDSEEITGYISYAAINYDHLSIRLTINQYLSSGTCNLTMTSGGTTVTRSADIDASASTSTCQGFDIPLSDLPSGAWQITVRITADGKSGTITGEASV